MDREEVSRIVREVLANHVAAPERSGHASTQVPASCRAAVLTGPGKMEIQTFPIRDISDDEILIRVEACGICGTDVHEFRGDPMKLAPLVLGHEGTGEVVKLGKNVTRDNGGKRIAVGDRIVTSVSNCGKCDACLYTPARLNLCESLRVHGLIPDDETHLNGYSRLRA